MRTIEFFIIYWRNLSIEITQKVYRLIWLNCLLKTFPSDDFLFYFEFDLFISV